MNVQELLTDMVDGYRENNARIAIDLDVTGNNIVEDGFIVVWFSDGTTFKISAKQLW